MHQDRFFYMRSLPHYQPPGGEFFVTFRLANSLPKEAVARWKNEQVQSNKEFLGTNDLRGKPTEYFAGSILIFRSKCEILLFRFRNKFGMTYFFGPRSRASGNSID